MRLSDLTEAKRPSRRDIPLVQAIMRDCQPFISALGDKWDRRAMWRGMDSWHFSSQYMYDMSEEELHKQPASAFEIIPLKNRRPTDTGKIFHHAIDSYFEAVSGIKFRSDAIFCTGDQRIASSYGDTMQIFPIGNFHFAYSPKIRDLYTDIFRNTDFFADESSHFDMPEKKVPILMWAAQIDKPGATLIAAWRRTIQALYQRQKQYEQIPGPVRVVIKAVKSDFTEILTNELQVFKFSGLDTMLPAVILDAADSYLVDYDFKLWISSMDDFGVTGIDEIADAMNRFHKIYGAYEFDTDILAAIKSKHEIMIHCDSYYAVPAHFQIFPL